MNRKNKKELASGVNDAKTIMQRMMASIQTLETLIEDAQKNNDRKKVQELTKRLDDEKRYWKRRLEDTGAKITSSRNFSSSLAERKSVQKVGGKKKNPFKKNCRTLVSILERKELAKK